MTNLCAKTTQQFLTVYEPYAYGTIICTIRVWLRYSYHMLIRVWYKYAYDTEQLHYISVVYVYGYSTFCCASLVYYCFYRNLLATAAVLHMHAFMLV